MSGYRLDQGGVLIDRARRVRFVFDGRPFEGFAGDTIASALAASGRAPAIRVALGNGEEAPPSQVALVDGLQVTSVSAGTTLLTRVLRALREKPLTLKGRDLPGVMRLSEGLALVQDYGVAPGQNVIVFCDEDDGLRAALDLHDAGAFVKAVVDMRVHPHRGLVAALAERGVRLEAGAVVSATRGRKALKGIDIRGFDAKSGQLGPNVMRPACDALLVSGDWEAIPRRLRSLRAIRSRDT
ncbi:2Fe-2S iron-sulfur cluster-binding protein [Stappia sp. ES.058]|uniref:2Fe-2S iron-sulfur cluster-binding protein n=1 Tax=Stappia sp. ES.058 TaxID=1881061 RepID=UPI0012FE0722|nr:2Fe-2S iron-sulfur cluster-binding protein [Stappia sp. ES.058]